MTSEIAIMNPVGVALATDSAVTFTSGDKNKIYNSVNKLFNLSKFHPIGIMVYGDSSINNIPWEIMIKEFRAEIGSSELKTVEEYANAFIEFTTSFISKLDNTQYFINYSQIFLRNIKSMLDNKVEQHFQANPTLSNDELLHIFESILINIDASFIDESKLKDLQDDQEIFINKEYMIHANDLINNNFRNLNLTRELYDSLQNLILKNLFYIGAAYNDGTLVRRLNSSSGLVFAGYGKNEIFPVVTEIATIQGVFHDFLLKSTFETRYGGPSFSSVIPFAQKEMVQTFIEGVDPYYQNLIINGVADILSLNSNTLLETLEPDSSKRVLLEQKIQPIIKDHFNKWTQGLDDFRRENFINPILSILSVLPKDELALMAESLISITSFKRRVSLEMETVGGAIDVAVISKGDGFIWIKRKHYFNPSLNHQFFENYYNKTK